MLNLEKSSRVLEFDKIRETLASYAPTAGARERALTLLPSSEISVVTRRLRYTTDAKRLAGIKGAPPFSASGNLPDILEKAEKSAVLSPREILDTASLLRTVRGLIDYIKGERLFETSLDEIFDRLVPIRTLEDRIFRAIIAEDLIADEASPALGDIRRKKRQQSSKIRDILQNFTSGSYAKFLQENIVTMRNGRYVLPVRLEHKNEIKGLVHDTSASGATVFIEPIGVVEANNELRVLESKEEAEIERILSEFSADIADHALQLRLDYQNVTDLAFYFTCAELSYKMDASEPGVSENGPYRLIKARHPLLDPKTVVPTTLTLGDEHRMMVVTGPNTGGKTVTLKTVGLLAMMAQSGLHIPAEEGSTVPVFDGIFPDIGDEQSIEQSLSTFSSHMVSIVSVLQNMTDRSLILFDELGAGTDPIEGAALATAILESVLSRGALCAATTHYAELKAFALNTDGVVNASCEFDVETLKPTYHLIVGTPGKSNAFAISEKLGLPEDVAHRARALVNGETQNFESVIGKLEETRLQLEREKETAENLRRDYEAFKKKAEEELRRKLGDAEREAEKAKAKAQEMISGAKATSEYIFDRLDKLQKEKDAANFGQTLSESKKALRAQLRAADAVYDPVIPDDENYVLPRAVVKGDRVIVRNFSKEGIVLDMPDKSGNVTVQVGNIRTKTNVKNLRLQENAKTETKKASVVTKKATLDAPFHPEIDVRGENGEDAWMRIDKYIDDAMVRGIQSVTVIHGKGTGALRAALWKFFKGDPRIKSFRNGAYGEGDYGVTVLELKS